ncbi:hypothetical protein [Lysobacter sp. CA199]|uniref:hypothetical protein n=1 Tax=Lysobacter sp. CA199 TaxID=3455608 RepID=UPI003F8D1111
MASNASHLPADLSVAPDSGGRRPRLPRRGRLIAAGLALILVLVGTTATAYALKQRQHSERDARIHAQVAQLFASQLGVGAICHLGAAPFASDRELGAIETRLRRLATPDQPMTLACGLSALARSHALSGHYPHAERLATESTTLLREAELSNLSVTATSVSLLNLQARYAPAEQVARAQLRRDDGALDTANRLDRLRLQIELARAQWGLADDDGAMHTLESALAQARTLVPPDAALIAELLTQRGEWRGRRFDFGGAERDLNQAIAINRGGAQADSARYYLVRMLSYSEQGDRAVAQAQRLVADRRGHVGERHPDTGRAWTALADALYGTGRYLDSARALNRGKVIVLASYGAEHPEYAEVLRLESQLDYMNNRYLDSVSKARRAVRICERVLGPTHEFSLRVRFNLAAKLTFGMDSVWGSAPYREGVAILEELVQTASEADIPAPYEKTVLAAALALRAPERELPRAERLLRDAQSEVRRYLPARSPSRFNIDYTLAWTVYRSGRQAQADRLFADYVAALDNGASLPLAQRMLIHDVLLVRSWYAMATCRRNDALALLRQAEDNDRRYLPSALPHARTVRDTIAQIERHGTLGERFGRERLGLDSPRTVDAKLYFDASARSQDCPRGLLAKG